MEPGPRDVRERRRKQRGAVQRLGPPQAHVLAVGELLEPDVDVLQNFHVVAKEAYGMNEDSAVPLPL